jgi:tRNA-uridine 2-sulfurtransferase
VRITVQVEGEHVVQAGFDASGCGAATAAASAVVTLATGRPLLEVARLTAEDVCAELGGLVPSKRHAAVLAADALHRALGAAAADGAPRLAPNPGRTLVAMSGGVDSAVAAQLALAAGHEVIGVTLELWADAETDGTRSCCSPQAVTGARALAHAMGIPHLTLDLRGRFRAEVVEDFMAQHDAGRTPNPCVRCNGRVRFDSMLELANVLGAARLATGHYARVQHGDGGALLRAAADPNKDQTYMLAAVPPALLGRLWFPLGELDKLAVRELARRAGLPVAEKPESQDLCFLAGTDGARFLARHGGSGGNGAGSASRDGDIVDVAGRVVGRHNGHERFTVGQRRGLGVATGTPLYVIRKDAAADRVVVGPRSALAKRRVRLSSARLHRPSTAVDRVKLRYRQEPVACAVDPEVPPGVHDRISVSLAAPVHGVAPGQTACLMQGDIVVGWARIEE